MRVFPSDRIQCLAKTSAEERRVQALHSLNLGLPSEHPLSINKLHLPEDHIGLLNLFPRRLVLCCPFAEDCDYTVRLFSILPLENDREFVLD